MAHLGNSVYVVAIDLGTTYSGYAFASKQDIQKDPPNFSTSNWQGTNLMSLKAPTAVLLNRNKELKAFGYDAETQFSDILADEEQMDYYYFHQFKMIFNKQEHVTRTTVIKDATGKPMEALRVFSILIQYLKNEVKKKIQGRLKDSLQDDDLYFVLTVPAIWDDASRQFMREAAETAGIKAEKLAIALEPEAASIFCQKLKTNRVEGQNDFEETVKAGMKYMVIDLGGGTVDITVHQPRPDGTIEEVVPPCGEQLGGISIDEAFGDFLAEICGTEVMKDLKEAELEDYIDLFRQFETKKRSIRTNQTDTIVINLPATLTDLVNRKHTKFADALEHSKYKDKVNYVNQKLQISPETFRNLFKNTIKEIIKLVKYLLKDPKVSNTNTILMVGGFSECDLVQEAIKKAIGKTRRLIIPEEASLAVMKGAVLFGHQPKVVSQCTARYTHRIQSWPDWDPDMTLEPKEVTASNKNLLELARFNQGTMHDLGNSIFVVGIDFGSTYSGYAFASRDDFLRDTPKISTANWQGGKLLSLKAPTAVLLNSNQELEAFGYEAENRFSEILADEEQNEYYYFHQFKMQLLFQRVTRTTEIRDATGKSMEAIKVFSVAIKYLKNEVKKRIQDKLNLKNSLQDDDIFFVLTVPAIWDDTAKQFMREAAVKAGIKNEKLAIASEPEAALIFCQRLCTDRVGAQNDFKETVKAEMKYMIIDLGGGTADIIVYQMRSNGTIEEVVPPWCGPWGGKSIDEAFSNLLAKICGTDVMKEFKENELEDYIGLFREFETKKRSFKTDLSNKIVITLPIALTDLVKKKHTTFANALEKSRYNVNYAKQKLHISPDVFRDLFNNTIKEITKFVESLLRDPKLSNTDTILMVGGFSGCELVQDALKSSVGRTRRLIIPEEADLAVLKGAVLHGYQRRIVGQRIAKYTYGVQGWADWDPDIHPETKKVIINGQLKCKDVLFKYVTKGDRIQSGHEVSRIFQVLKPEENTYVCTVYISSDENPQYITDPSCQCHGNLVIQLPPHLPGQNIEVQCTLIFGDTELICRVSELRTGRMSEVQFYLW